MSTKPVDDVFSDSEGSEGWNDVDEAGEEEETLDIVSLLDDKVFPDAASMLTHCKDKYGFDFVATRDRLGLDFYGSIKLVNYSESLLQFSSSDKEEVLTQVNSPQHSKGRKAPS